MRYATRNKREDSTMLEEFKKFAMRGNVIDLAVGVVIGAAFGAIVASLVGDIIMPIVGAVSGGLDFSNYYTALSSKVQSGLSYADAKKQGAVLGWGQFLTIALNFAIVAWVLFMVIKGINKLKKAEPTPAPPGPSPEAKLLTEIRDLLKK
jgi:large conductance mechanosensitive channel